MQNPEQFTNLARLLRRVVEASPTTPDDVPRWDGQSAELETEIRAASAGIDLPVQIWHYLNDGDIRATDVSYRNMQNEVMAECIAAFERGEVPPSRGMTISFSPWTLLVVAVFVSALVFFGLKSCR